jgi:hypothetical protein
MADVFIDRFCEVGLVVDKFLKFKDNVQAVMASYREVCMDMQKGRAVEDDLFLQ